MSLGTLLRQRLEVLRSSATDTLDDWQDPVLTEDAVVLTVRGLIQPVSMEEAAELNDDGPTAADYKAYTAPGDIRTGDRIRDAVVPAVVYEIRELADWSGYRGGPHLRLMLHRVSP